MIRRLFLALGLWLLAGPVFAQPASISPAPVLSVGTAIQKGDGFGGLAAAVAKTDYAPPSSGSALQLGDGLGGFSGFAGNTCSPGGAYASAIGANGTLTCSTPTSVYFLASGLINKFIDPGFNISQLGTTSGSVSGGTTSYTLDAWQLSATGASLAWSQQYNANLPGNSLRLSAASGLTAATLQQRIDSFKASQLLSAARAVQAVTVQCNIYNNSGANVTPKLQISTANSQDNFGAVTSDLSATNMQTINNTSEGVIAYTYTPSSANNVANGLQVQIQFGGALNGISGNIDVGQCDIRPTPGLSTGVNASPATPEIPFAGEELAAVQRRYAVVKVNRLYVSVVGSATDISTYPLPVTMATTPGSVTSSGVSTTNVASSGVAANDNTSINLSVTASSGSANTQWQGKIIADGRL